jgi:hypothetical protein
VGLSEGNENYIESLRQYYKKKQQSPGEFFRCSAMCHGKG